MCNLLSCQLVRLEACLSWDFQRSGCHAPGIPYAWQKIMGRQSLVPISGRVPVLNLEFTHGQSGVQPTVENLPKDRHGSGGFLRWIFLVAKCKRKIRRKIRQPKTKNPPAHDPPEIRQPGPKIRRKTYQQIRLSNLQVHARLFSIEKDCSWRRLQSMDSGTLFGCLLGMVEAPMLKCTCNPSAAAGGMNKVCCAPFQTTLLLKNVRFQKPAQK